MRECVWLKRSYEEEEGEVWRGVTMCLKEKRMCRDDKETTRIMKVGEGVTNEHKKNHKDNDKRL